MARRSAATDQSDAAAYQRPQKPHKLPTDSAEEPKFVANARYAKIEGCISPFYNLATRHGGGDYGDPEDGANILTFDGRATHMAAKTINPNWRTVADNINQFGTYKYMTWDHSTGGSYGTSPASDICWMYGGYTVSFTYF